MHEEERHRIILATVNARPVASVADLVEITGSSEATIRRDIAAMNARGDLRRVRGGAEAVNRNEQGMLLGRPFAVNQTMDLPAKRAIARKASELFVDGEQVIINGGTTTYQLVPHLVSKHMTVFTNSFPIAEFLLHNSRNTVVVPGGTVYREQSVILSPFGGTVASHFYARKMFMGCQGISSHGLMETDPLIVQSELTLMGQADELIVLADSSKFHTRTSLIICSLQDVSTIITDTGLRQEDRAMIESAGIALVVVDPKGESRRSAADA